MKWFGAVLAATVLFIACTGPNSFTQTSPGKMECRCHSKQPAMKHMHEVIGLSNCGNCHQKSDNLMSRRGAVDPNRRQNLLKRISEDSFCIPCHDSQGSVRKEALAGQKSLAISNTLYCPQDKLKFSPGTAWCPKCGGRLLDVNAVMERSRRDPSNQICIECHGMEEVRQIQRHGIFNSQKLSQCLDCHQGHNDCAGCHH